MICFQLDRVRSRPQSSLALTYHDENLSGTVGADVVSERLPLPRRLPLRSRHRQLGITGKDVQARVEAVNGSLSRSDSFAIDGVFGKSEFTMYVSVNHVANLAIVHGHVSRASVYLDAALGHSGGPHVVTGSYQGPPLLLLLAMGSIVQFLR